VRERHMSGGGEYRRYVPPHQPEGAHTTPLRVSDMDGARRAREARAARGPTLQT